MVIHNRLIYHWVSIFPDQWAFIRCGIHFIPSFFGFIDQNMSWNFNVALVSYRSLTLIQQNLHLLLRKILDIMKEKWLMMLMFWMNAWPKFNTAMIKRMARGQIRIKSTIRSRLGFGTISSNLEQPWAMKSFTFSSFRSGTALTACFREDCSNLSS